MFQVLEEVKGVYEVIRLTSLKKIIFYASLIFSFVFWIAHPVLISCLLKFHNKFPFLASIFTYLELISLLGIIACLHLITHHTFPHWENNRFYWASSFFLIIMATMTILTEAAFLNINYRWEVIGFTTCLLSFLLALQYFYICRHKKRMRG